MSSFLLFLQICYWQLLKNRLDIMNLSSETPQGSTSVFFFFHKSFPPSSLSLFFFYSDPVLVADSQDCCLKLLTPQAPRFSPSLSFFFFFFLSRTLLWSSRTFVTLGRTCPHTSHASPWGPAAGTHEAQLPEAQQIVVYNLQKYGRG